MPEHPQSAPAIYPPAICLIVVVAENNVIGLNGKMPWHLPSELKYFRARTIGKPVIMGRKTFQSIGKPLPGRDNIVITRDSTFAPPGIGVASNLDAALILAHAASAKSGADEIMIIGGAEIYTQALPLVGRIYFTRIAATPAGDTWFPPLDPTIWGLVGETSLPKSQATEPSATACIYHRRQPPT